MWAHESKFIKQDRCDRELVPGSVVRAAGCALGSHDGLSCNDYVDELATRESGCEKACDDPLPRGKRVSRGEPQWDNSNVTSPSQRQGIIRERAAVAVSALNS
jgi:hypothetical protein